MKTETEAEKKEREDFVKEVAIPMHMMYYKEEVHTLGFWVSADGKRVAPRSPSPSPRKDPHDEDGPWRDASETFATSKYWVKQPYENKKY